MDDLHGHEFRDKKSVYQQLSARHLGGSNATASHFGLPSRKWRRFAQTKSLTVRRIPESRSCCLSDPWLRRQCLRAARVEFSNATADHFWLPLSNAQTKSKWRRFAQTKSLTVCASWTQKDEESHDTFWKKEVRGGAKARKLQCILCEIAAAQSTQSTQSAQTRAMAKQKQEQFKCNCPSTWSPNMY